MNTQVNVWQNFGDVNFWNGGTLVRKVSENEYQIIKCVDCDDKFYIVDLYVDITDTWFEKDLDSIASFADCKVRDFENEDDKIWFAIVLTDYYNPENFGASYEHTQIIGNVEECLEWLQGYEIGTEVVDFSHE